jgi:peptide/nickel transport system permease protein
MTSSKVPLFDAVEAVKAEDRLRVQDALTESRVDQSKVPKVRKQGRFALVVATTWLVVLTAMAVLGDLLPFIDDPQKRSRAIRKPPSWDHLFGTNKIGQDLFSRSIYGARISLSIAFGAIAIGAIIATALGLASGYYKGRWDSVISTAVDIMLSYPALILLLAITTFIGRDPKNIVLAFTILSVPPLVRLIRASTTVYANREFVTAARSLGASNSRIILREILPNVVPTLLSTMMTGMAVLIIAEGGLAALGQSVPLEVPTWGKLIFDGYQQIEKYPHLSLAPALMLFVTILSFNIIGDILSRRFDIKESLA